MSKYFQTHVILFSVSVICFVSSFFESYDSLDIALHDTYFVIDLSHIFILFGTYFLICSLTYFLLHKFERKKIKFLFGIHTWVSILTCISFIILVSKVGVENAPKRYVDYSVYDEFEMKSTGPFGEINDYLSLSFILFLIAQMIFLINIGIGILSKRTN